MHRRGIRGQELSASACATARAPAATNRPAAPVARAGGPLLLAALTLLFLGRVLFTGDVLLPARYLSYFPPWQSQVSAAGAEQWNPLAWDAIAQYYPWRAFAHDTVARGVIPLWNPHQFCGMPFIANSQSAVFYPPNLLFYIMDPARAFALSAALHLLLAGLFTYMFLRALCVGRFGSTFGGAAFAFCGFLAAWLQLPTVLDTATWLPLALLCIERFRAVRRAGYGIGLGFVIGTAALAGHPQMLLYVAGAAALYFIFRALSPGAAPSGRLRWARDWIGGGAIAAVVALLWAAVQLLPSVELLPLSHRAHAAAAEAYAAYLRFAMPWQQLITLVLPDFMGNPVQGSYWGRGNLAEYAAYVGALPLALAVLAVLRRRDQPALFFAALAAFALLTALGTPINLLLFYAVPGFSSLGGPARMLFIYSAAIAILAGMGADAAAAAMADSRAGARSARQLALVAAMLIAVTVALILVIALALGVRVGVLIAAPAVNIVVSLVALGAGVAAVWAVGWRVKAPAALAVLFIASICELFAFGATYYRTAPRASVYPATALTTYLRRQGVGGRVMPLYESWGLRRFPRAVLPPNSGMVYGLYDIQGYDSLYLATYRSVLAAVEGRDPSPLANGNMLLGASPDRSLLAVLGVHYVVSEPPLDRPGLTLERAGEVNVYRVENSVPRAYVARTAVTAGDLRGALAKLSEASTRGVVLEGPEPVKQAPSQVSGAAPINILPSDNPNRVTLAASQPGYAVLSDAYYPGWRTRVDGEPAEIRIANGAFRAVWVGPGAHKIEMRFEPTSFRLGLFATLIAAAIGAGALGALVLGGGRKPR